MRANLRQLAPRNCSAKRHASAVLPMLRVCAGLILVPLLLGACSSMSAEECSVLDWRSVGYEDGVAGLPGNHTSVNIAKPVPSMALVPI